jgi:hypothetical protein
MDGYYRFVWGQHSLSPGFSFIGRSGQPITPLSTPSNDYITFILPRGSAGRTPFVTQLDMHLSYQNKLSKTLSVEVFVDIFNILNQKTVLTVDSTYTYNHVVPTTSLTQVFVADKYGNPTSTLAEPNANYLQPTSYQAPISGRLGARVLF